MSVRETARRCKMGGSDSLPNGGRQVYAAAGSFREFGDLPLGNGPLQKPPGCVYLLRNGLQYGGRLGWPAKEKPICSPTCAGGHRDAMTHGSMYRQFPVIITEIHAFTAYIAVSDTGVRGGRQGRPLLVAFVTEAAIGHTTRVVNLRHEAPSLFAPELRWVQISSLQIGSPNPADCEVAFSTYPKWGR